MAEVVKFTDKDVYAAIRVLEEIVDIEDFDIDIVQEGDGLCFCVNDHQNAYLGGLYSERFQNLGELLDRLDTYHQDYLYSAFDDRVDEGEVIPRDDWNRKCLIFLESDFCKELLSVIDVETYQRFPHGALDATTLAQGVTGRYVSAETFDALGYLCDKSVARQIMDTQSAFPMVEHEGTIYIAAGYAWYDDCEHPHEQMLDDVIKGNAHCNTFTAYGVVIETEIQQILEDFRDIGFYDADGNWGFYLSERELEYVGLGDAKDRFKENYDFGDADVKRYVDEYIAEAEAKAEFSREETESSKRDLELGFRK